MPDLPTLQQTLSSITVSLITYALYRVASKLSNVPTHHLNGPKSPSLVYGSFQEILNDKPGAAWSRWVKVYGRTFSHAGMLGENVLVSLDPKAIHHILTRSDIYHKPVMTRYSVGRALGLEGLFMVEGEKHRKQRKVMNPAFGPAQIRELTHIFTDKAIDLRDIWMQQLGPDGSEEIDINPWLSHLMLDVIGLAGFNHRFDFLSATRRSEFADAVHVLLTLGTSLDPVSLLRGSFPILSLLPTSSDRKISAARLVIGEVALKLIEASRAAWLQEKESNGMAPNQQKDLISLLVRELLNAEPGEDHMSDDEIQHQITTFLVAGTDATAASVAWALFALATNSAIQTQLRAEFQELPTDRPTMDELNALPYLDLVVRETLRLYCPATAVPKVAMQDDIIPLSNPIVDKYGKPMSEIRVEKGQVTSIPILLINTDEEIWGEDAAEFRPERWNDLPDSVKQVHGVWSNTLTFIGGPHACIGFRFAIVELKATLFTMIRAFEVQLATPAEDIVALSTAALKKPTYVKGEKGTVQFPLRLRRVVNDT